MQAPTKVAGQVELSDRLHAVYELICRVENAHFVDVESVLSTHVGRDVAVQVTALPGVDGRRVVGGIAAYFDDSPLVDVHRFLMHDDSGRYARTITAHGHVDGVAVRVYTLLVES